jgi:uncharacterized protein (DUF608 family)
MIKNIVIAVLLVHILNMYDGWAVQGIERYVLSIVLAVLIATIIYAYEKVR